MIRTDNRRLIEDANKVKLWEITYNPVYKTPEYGTKKSKPIKGDDCLIVDYGSNITRAVVTI
jgi:hypothetical protein